jgi:hypothetical protein
MIILARGEEEADMVTIETTIEVDERGRAFVRMPPEMKPGTHRAVVIVFDRPEASTVNSDFSDFPRHDIPWPFPEGYTFRREEMYGDDGR